MFVPGVKSEFLLRRSPTTTFLNGASAQVTAHKIRIHSAELKVRRCKRDPEVYSAGEGGDRDGEYKYQHNQL